MIGGAKCLVGVIVHQCEHGEQTLEHYVFFEGEETIAQETLKAMVEAKAEAITSGMVAARVYPGTMFVPSQTH